MPKPSLDSAVERLETASPKNFNETYEKLSRFSNRGQAIRARMTGREANAPRASEQGREGVLLADRSQKGAPMTIQRNRTPMVLGGIAYLLVFGATAARAVCPATPDVTCSFSAAASLRYTKPLSPAKNRLSFRFSKGANAVRADFGDPTTTDSYGICIYPDGAAPITLSVPADGDCTDKACWVSKLTSVVFKDRTATNNGVSGIRLSAPRKPVDKTKIAVNGKGVNLPNLSLPLAVPVTVQVRNSLGNCWGAIFSDVKQDAATGKLTTKLPKGTSIPTCSDFVSNGYETDLDCGGGCSPCAFGKYCAVAADCTTGICQAGRCGAKRVFVTSTTVNGGFGGLAGGDSICNAIGTGAYPGTTWVAWLSTSSVNAIDRINDTAYRLLDGTEAFSDKAQITTTGKPFFPVAVDQHGQPVSGNAWSGTTNYGSSVGGCNDWTTSSSLVDGTVGNPAVEASWSDSAFAACNTLNRLICFQQ